jgi:hypothetical protein
LKALQRRREDEQVGNVSRALIAAAKYRFELGLILTPCLRAQTTVEIRVTYVHDNRPLANASVELSKPGTNVVIQRASDAAEMVSALTG